MPLQGTIETRVGVFVLIALGILAYMGFQIGAFRFDWAKYSSYTMYFKDSSGLTRKAEVKIAGVKVGWVEDIELVSDHTMQAQVKVMVLKEYNLHTDAYAIVRQDGLLGPKFVEIIVGDPLLPLLPHGGTLEAPSVEPVSVDELLRQMKKIATNVEDVTRSFKCTFGGEQGQEQLHTMVTNLTRASDRIANFSDVVERIVSRNEGNIDVFLSIGHDIRQVSDQLNRYTLPSLQESIERISAGFDRDFHQLATQLSETARALEDASLEARDSLHSVNSVAHKIDEGQGLLGKLINEDETYRDLKVAVEGLKDYFARMKMMEIIFDGHTETMQRPAENWIFEDSKFYLDMRIHPNEDHFFLLQLAASQKGNITRFAQRKTYRVESAAGPEVTVSKLDSNSPNPAAIATDPEDIFIMDHERYNRNTIQLDVQLGKVFNDIALRVGLMDGYGGVGIDFDIPFRSDTLRWVTTLEAFDFTGWNRKDDRRPHLKWLNKMYFMRNLYFTFGADDFVSKYNSNGFFGVGLRFGDDNVKYVLPSLSASTSGITGGG